MNYNKNLFQQTGMSEPEVGWTWEDLFNTAEQLARLENGEVKTYGLLDPSSSSHLFNNAMRSQGVDLGSIPAEQFNFERAELKEVIERVRRMRAQGALLIPKYMDPDGQDDVDLSSLRRDGRLAMWGSGYFDSSAEDDTTQQNDLPFEVGTVAYPADDYFFANNGEGYVISAGTAYPQEAWRWISFLSSQPATTQVEMALSTGAIVVPARKSVADATGFWDGFDAETTAAIQWALEHLVGEADRPRDGTVLGIIGSLTFDVFDKTESSSRELLANAQKQLQEEIAAGMLTPTSEPPSEPLVVATPEPQTAAGGRTIVTFTMYGPSYTNIKQLIKQFHEQQSEVFVQLQSTASFTNTGSLESLAQTNDCFIWSGAPPAHADAALLDVQPFVDSDATFRLDDYSEVLLAPFQANNALYGLPYTVQLRALHYNKTLFSSSGIAAPTERWTPDDFLAAAQANTSGIGGEKQYGYVPLTGAYPDMLFFIHQFGGQLMINNGANLRPNFADPKVIAAIRWYLDLARVHQVTPPLETLTTSGGGGSEVAMNLIREGRAAMWLGDSYRSFGPQQNLDLSLDEGLAPLPIGSSTFGTNDMFLQSLHISSQTEHAPACWQWLSFLSNDASVASSGVIPARLSVAQQIQFSAEAPAEETLLFERYVNLLRDSESGENIDAEVANSLSMQWFFQAIQNIIMKNDNVEEELAKAQQSTSDFLACMSQSSDEEKCIQAVASEP